MMKEIKKNISLLCSTCGNDQFSALDTNLEDLKSAPTETSIQCSDCGKVFTKAELLEENQEKINANIQEIKKDAVKELKKILNLR